MEHREITLARDCQVVLIPSGEEATLTAGSPVIVTQSLGGTYTVATQTGRPALPRPMPMPWGSCRKKRKLTRNRRALSWRAAR